MHFHTKYKPLYLENAKERHQNKVHVLWNTIYSEICRHTKALKFYFRLGLIYEMRSPHGVALNLFDPIMPLFNIPLPA